MSKNYLRELYVEELKDLYSAENQLTKALPKLAKAASSEELRQGFEEHMEQRKDTFSVCNGYSNRWAKKAPARSVWGWKAW